MTAQSIRPLAVDDVPLCRDIYRRAARESDPHGGYSPRQREVWAQFADEEGFADFIREEEGWVFEEAGRICAFCSYEHNGYIRTLYVAPDYQRRGIGGALLEFSLRRLTGAPRIWSIASLFSRGLFARFGFELVETEEKEYQGVVFLRYIMEFRSHES